MKMYFPPRHAGNYSPTHDMYQHMDYDVRKINGEWIVGKQTRLYDFLLHNEIITLLDSSFFQSVCLRSYETYEGQEVELQISISKTWVGFRAGNYKMRIAATCHGGVHYDFPEL